MAAISGAFTLMACTQLKAATAPCKSEQIGAALLEQRQELQALGHEAQIDSPSMAPSNVRKPARKTLKHTHGRKLAQGTLKATATNQTSSFARVWQLASMHPGKRCNATLRCQQEIVRLQDRRPALHYFWSSLTPW